MAERIEVDPRDVARMAADLEAVGWRLATTGRQIEYATGAIGSAELAGALADADAGWRVHRERLLEAVGGLADAADAAARTYTAVETEITAGLAGAGRPSVACASGSGP